MNRYESMKNHITVPDLPINQQKLNISEPERLLNNRRKNGIGLDSTDLALLRILSADSTLTAAKIAKMLKAQKIQMTERGIRKRIASLEKHGIIKSHTIVIDDSVAGKNTLRIILVKFKNTTDFVQRLEKYKQYIADSPYCTFAVRIRGDLDWLHYKCFPTKELADAEDDIFRSVFGDIMQEYRSYDAEIIKSDFGQILDIDSIRQHLDKIANHVSKK
jgi:DNA-binding Lrp family transcriptional regulator